MMQEAPVRLALVGAGRWGRICLRNLAGLEGARLVAVASANPDTAALLPAGCRLFADWRDMLAPNGIGGGGVDGVIVATPPDSHAAIAIAALEAGSAVLVEKPVTLDSAEALAIRAAAVRAGRMVQVDHIHLFGPAFRTLKRLARQIGPVRAIRGVAGNHGPYRTDASVLFDWGPHDVSMCLDLLGALPDSAEARSLGRTPVEGGTAERLRLRLGFGPIEAEVVLGTDMDKTRRFEVECAKGTLVYDDLAAHKLTRDGQPVEIASVSPLAVVLGEFVAGVAAGSQDLSGLDLGIAVVEVLARCQSTLV